jgi:hypothetical protein
MNKGIALLALGAIFIGGGCVSSEYTSNETGYDHDSEGNFDIVMEDEGSSEATSDSSDSAADTYISIKSLLSDVTGGESSGVAIATWTEGESQYRLLATSSNLPDPAEGFFYEGWIVRKSPLDVLSTGALMPGDSVAWKNDFKASEDLTDHTSYIVTLEPDDDDPAPAEHILEGEMK